MGSRAAESVVEVEMAESRIKVVTPEQADHPSAKPDALRATGRAGYQTGGFGKFIGSALPVFARLAGGPNRWFDIATLSQGSGHS
jgi:hypothetical protein